MGQMTTLFCLRRQFRTIQWVAKLTKSVCQMVIVVWSYRVETKSTQVRLDIKSALNAKKYNTKRKIHKIKNKPSVRDNGRSQHIGSHFLVWKGKNSGKISIRKFTSHQWRAYAKKFQVWIRRQGEKALACAASAPKQKSSSIANWPTAQQISFLLFDFWTTRGSRDTAERKEKKKQEKRKIPELPYHYNTNLLNIQ